MKKTIISLVCVLVVAVVGTTLWCLYPAIVGAVNGSRYYTYNDMENQYQTGYSDGNKAEAELTERNQYLQELTDTQATEIASLNTAYREKLNALYAELAELRETAERVPGLEQQIDELQASIAHYEDLLTKIGAEDFYIANYFVGQELYAATAVKKGDKLTAVDAPKKYAKFLGWSLDGMHVVDLNELEVTSNLKLTALFSYRIDIISYTGWDHKKSETIGIVTNNLTTVRVNEGQTLQYYREDGELITKSLRDDDGQFYLTKSAGEMDERYWQSATGDQAYIHGLEFADSYGNNTIKLYKYTFTNEPNLGYYYVMLNLDAITGVDIGRTYVKKLVSDCEGMIFTEVDRYGTGGGLVVIPNGEYLRFHLEFDKQLTDECGHTHRLTLEVFASCSGCGYDLDVIDSSNTHVNPGTNFKYIGDTSKGYLAMTYADYLNAPTNKTTSNGIQPCDPNEMH